MNKKMFVFDVDGTLINSKGQILPETKEALLDIKAAGHLLAFCSGRPYYDMAEVIKDVPFFDYAICNNGAYYVDLKSNAFFSYKFVPPSIIKSIIDIGREHETLFALHTTEGVYRTRLFQNEPSWVKAAIREEWYRFEIFDFDVIQKVLEKGSVTQVSLRTSKETAELLFQYVEKFNSEVDVHIAGEVYLDINPLNTSKLSGINDLLKTIDVKLKDVVAFGDSGNDLQMLAGVGLGVAMGNGTKEAKEAAHVVIGSHNDSSIARKLKEFL